MKRYLQLDALRGFFLIIMTLDHYGGFWPRLFYQRIGYVTAAEGFVLLSGIVAGMVYGRYRDRKKLFRKSLERSFTIYKYYIITIVIVFLLLNTVTFYNNYWGGTEYSNFSLVGLISSFLLFYQPPFLDILPMYIFLVLLMPFMIYFLQQKRIWLFWILTLLMWLFGYLFTEPDILLKGMILGVFPVEGYFNFLSWQLIFFIGIYFGFRKQENAEYQPKYPAYMLLSAFLIGVIFFLVNNFKFFGLTPVRDLINNDTLFHFFFNKIRLGIGRVINFLAISYLVAFVLMKFKSKFKYSWLIILGQSSIKVFTVHLIIWFFVYPLVQFIAPTGLFWHAIFSLAMLIPLYLVVIKQLPIKLSFGISKSQILNYLKTNFSNLNKMF